MTATWPAKTDYATGNILTAAQMNAIGEELNYLYTTPSTPTSYGFAAGKNKVINGDMYVNQRGFTSTTTSNTYGFDRWRIINSGGTVTYSAQTFTAGTAPVSGYEGKQYARIVSSGQSAAGDYALFNQAIENVRTFAGQTVTLSFWAKAASGTPKIGINFEQLFGSGGSSTVIVTATSQTISTSWARYSVTVSVPSISGKTIGGADNALALDIWTSCGSIYASYSDIGVQNATIDIWGIQLEAGSTATSFQTATGTIQGELAACQRYYYRQTAAALYTVFGTGQCGSSTTAQMGVKLPVTMRTYPTTLEYSTLRLSDESAGYAVTGLTFNSLFYSADYPLLSATVASGLTAQRFYSIGANNSTSAYIGIGAEF